MLVKRVITAVIALPIALAIFIWAPRWFIIPLLLLCLTLSSLEIAMMLFPRFDELLGGRRPLDNGAASPKKSWLRRYYRPVIVAAIGWAIFLSSTVGTYAGGRGILVVGLVIGLLVGSFSSRNIDVAAARGLCFIVSLVLGVLPWLAVWDLYLMGEGSRFIFLLMAIVWGSDTGAYFAGRAIGGRIIQRRLAAHISPNKTWEGAIAGALCGVAGALLINLAYLGDIGSWWLIAAIGLVGGLFGQVGDLVESTLKRFSRVKDSGRLLPGHGGFLDRVDGLLTAAPVIWLMLYTFPTLQ